MYKTSESIKELAIALAKAQGQIAAAPKGSVNPAFRSKYANLADVWTVARPSLSANGLSVVQMPVDCEAGRVALTTLLLHASGEWIESTVSTRITKDDPQGVGSALTYLRRYAFAAIVGVVADDDDDGNAASQPAQQRQAQPQQQAQQRQAPKPQDKTASLRARIDEVFKYAASAGLSLPVEMTAADLDEMPASQLSEFAKELDMTVDALEAV